MQAEKILEVENLVTSFRTERGTMKAVDGVSFFVQKGEMLGIVGESGCGKSVTSQSIMRLYDEKYLATIQGKVILDDQNLLDLPLKKMQSIRGNKVSMVFQDALSALNPVETVGSQIVEAIRIHKKVSKKEAKKKALEMMRLVGIPAYDERFFDYPHQLSGGMRQRIMIAIALSCEPKLLIADEPTTALDVTIQAQIMDLMVSLNKRLGMSVMLITHDLAVVAETCSRVIVMYLGQIVEEAEVKDIFESAAHPYTQGLMNSIPKLEDERKRLDVIKGTVPLLNQIPMGCRFAPRCPHATEKCTHEMPQLVSIRDKHNVRCWYPEEKGSNLNDTNKE